VWNRTAAKAKAEQRMAQKREKCGGEVAKMQM